MSRTDEAIFIVSSGNLQLGYKFFDLRTGRKIPSRICTALPMPSAVINLVNKIGISVGRTSLLIFMILNMISLEIMIPIL